ncbi:MFS transporter [Streptomyces boetiae]|uniref:MFS transporter n=1 Tax=Streptomyces boetiae TaxID=3075541 RepID=UPI00374E1ABE
MATGLVLAAFNLGPAISGLGPVLAEARADLGMSGAVAGLLTSIPALCFGRFGVAAPRLARRFGLAAISAGLALRALDGSAALFLVTTALALAGIAVGNVLMPVLVKRYFPDRVGAMTGLYSAGFAAGTALAAALTIPVASAAGGWRVGLAVWSASAGLALLPWAVVALRAGRDRREAPSVPEAARPPGRGSGERLPSLARSRTARSLAVLFGLQATAAYVTLGCVPQIFRDAGVSASTAGLLLAVIMGSARRSGSSCRGSPPACAGRARWSPPSASAAWPGTPGWGWPPAAGAWAWAWAVLPGVANCAFPWP